MVFQTDLTGLGESKKEEQTETNPQFLGGVKTSSSFGEETKPVPPFDVNHTLSLLELQREDRNTCAVNTGVKGG